MGIDREYEKFEKHPYWFGLSRGMALVVILVILGAIGTVGGLVWNYLLAGPQGAVAARQIIQADGNYRIQAYQHFFDLCQSVQTNDDQIASQYAVLNQYPKNDHSDRNRVLTNIAGLEAFRASNIREYNADATQSYTVGQFRSSALPYQLPTHPYRKGESISCAS